MSSVLGQIGNKHNAPPNIILIVSDDQGYHDLGSYGNGAIITPHLDRLAAEGVRFTDFYVTSSICTPSRSGLLTGRYPQRNGTYELFRNDRVDEGYQYNEAEYSTTPERILGTDLREVFISEILKKAGYTNGIFGKWDLGQLRRFLPLQQGFDRFYGFVNTGIDYFTHQRYGIGSMYSDNEPTTADKGTYSTDLFTRKALRFLDENREKPFFLYLPYNAPHSASSLDPTIRSTVQAPEETRHLYPMGKTKKENQTRDYRAAVTRMDESIGDILKRVAQHGLEDNTLVVFLSDNGGGVGSDNSPLRGRKGQFWEGGIRVPCIIKWPGQIEAGAVNRDFVTSLELFPTLLAAAGVAHPNDVTLDGFNLLPRLMGGTEKVREEMFWELREDQAARVGTWKWVASPKGSGLFNLEKDIGEQYDLTAEQPEVARKMREKFAAWQSAMQRAEPRGPFRDY
ncbi:sulfatase-like hydrolase/transferase [Persicitalea jodogahamensis]|nr:sulfatase-like hydrolase/transferase [Persicitalea jodogahamensis]